MESYNNPANLNMEKGFEQSHKSPETLLENNLESGRNTLQVQERKGKRPRIQKPLYSVKLA
jgi:hypothetical protein